MERALGSIGLKGAKARPVAVALPLSNFVAGRWRLASEASQKSDNTSEAGTKKHKSPWNRGGGANRLVRGGVDD